MNIGILGAGSVGSTLGRRLAAVGHHVSYGVRDVNKREQLLEGHPGTAVVVRTMELPGRSDILVLAVPFPAMEDALKGLGNVTGKILIDATNPLKPDLSGLVVTGEDSAGERVARLAKGARVVKAFNTIGAPVMADPVIGSERAMLTVCSDDAQAKQVVMGLGLELGFDAVDFGPLRNARLSETLAMAWIWLAYVGRWGTGFALTIAKR